MFREQKRPRIQRRYKIKSTASSHPWCMYITRIAEAKTPRGNIPEGISPDIPHSPNAGQQ